MRCPYCDNTEDKVIDSRMSGEGLSTRRRRECLKCKKRFTTYEKLERSDLYVIKKDGRREKFDRQKLRNGIEKAFEKRPISIEKIQDTIEDIEEQIRRKGKREIKTSIIGDLVSKRIKRLDKIAYIRFASVYQDFQDIGDFKKQIKEL